MLIHENFIDYRGSRLHYAKAGHGPAPLLLFHGFGQDYKVFDVWSRALESKYTIYAFDLFFHGQSTWPLRRPLEKSDWRQIMMQFLGKEKIELFVVVGFSLGGKFALATLEAFTDKVTKVVLLAPDGIKTSLWYNLATYPIAVRRLFKSMVLQPQRFFTLAQFFQRVGLVNKGLVRFAESQMDTEEKRRRVYYSWVYFRHLKFDIPSIAAILNQHRIPLLMLVGKYDKVIPAKNMNTLLHRLHQKQLEIIEAGHNDLVKAAVKFIQ
jgi:pimeloyl-ACP methyl ester carboxylesterase